MENTPGLGFRPHDDELVGYFLRHKILGDTHLVKDFISEVNICNYDPWNLRLQSKVKSRDLVWYFFSKRENKYASGNQQSRRTPSGFWKLTGDSVDVKDQREFWCGIRGKIGYKRVLVFQRGRNSSSKGTKSDWVMHELHYTLLPEDQETYVICRLEYKGEDMNILSYNPTVLTPAFVASMTQSAGSVVDQPLQAYSGSHNTYPEYDSPIQGQQLSENSHMDQLLQGNSGSFHNYGSANQGPQFGGNFNMDQSIQENLGFFNSSFEYGSENQGNWFTRDLNTQQQAPTGMYEEEPQMIWNNDIHRDYEFLGDQMAYMQENRSNHRPRNPVTGVLADCSGDSDTDSMLGRDTSSSIGSVGSSNGSWHTPRDDVLSWSSIEPKHNHEAKEQPKQLKSQLQGKEKVMNAQRSECEWKMAEDTVKKAPSTIAVKQSWIVLEEISQRKSHWTYLRNMMIGFLLLISIISRIIVIG